MDDEKKGENAPNLHDSSSSLNDRGQISAIQLSEYGVHRGLQSHHIQLLAISGVIGTGLFVGTSGVLSSAGPAGLLIGYSIWCIFLLCVAHTMGEMSAFLPVPGSFVTRVVFVLNCLAVKYFGEVEFYASIFKIFLIFGFLLFTFVVVLGGNPKHDRIGFRYWRDPGAFNETYTKGTTGRFLSIWGIFNTAAFAIGGPDFIANCASEAVNPRRNIPKAVRRVIYRLIFFFVLSVFVVGLLVPYNDPTMLTAIASGNGVAKSPFIIAMNRLEMSFLPDLCNAVVITSAWSCTNCLLFQASRTVFGLAKHGRAPKIFAKTTKTGVPIPALVLSTAVASLAFMTCNTASAVVLNWFINLGSTAIMIAYILMMVANLQFHKGLMAQGIDAASLPFRSKLTPYSNYFAIFWVGIILLTNGYGKSRPDDL
ncbi:putative proline-specific permease put4 [Colletotrichum aenigma]|uniref:putative proline-specific permease put4 n=1 Tax=Colletotrichum aenigma TaxID=1215731 RepID=UPI001872504E|nr:putative proline-specific permease put4 [Colletotrichum aenigma]KAF5518133.1 putative proline-specific permease put4 [Colletotrichum aenigma]